MPALNFKKEFVTGVLRGLYPHSRVVCREFLKRHNKNAKWAAPLSEREYLIEINKFIDTHFKAGIKPKRQTIRSTRKSPFQQGDTLYLYTGMRTSFCIKLEEVKAKAVEHVHMRHLMGEFLVCIGTEIYNNTETMNGLNRVALKDGFTCINDMRDFFVPNVGDEFEGQLIQW